MIKDGGKKSIFLQKKVLSGWPILVLNTFERFSDRFWSIEYGSFALRMIHKLMKSIQNQFLSTKLKEKRPILKNQTAKNAKIITLQVNHS